MNVWYAKAAILAASIAMVAIRAPHGERSRTVRIAKDRKGGLETAVLAFAFFGFFVPLIWVARSKLFAFAEYRLMPLPFAVGLVFFATGLWLFYRSHADLGRNWSITLQIREEHRLVTDGVYRGIRHPMYTSLFLYSIGQLLALPNWFAGPSYLVTFGLLFLLRIRAEEQMMVEEFGEAYEAYRARTKRLVPGVW